MAESPLGTIARLLAGVVLMEGRLGHQVLGQLLVMNTNEAAIAGAAVVVAGTSGQRSAVGQVVLRTVVPALAVGVLLHRTEERIERKGRLLDDRELHLEERERDVNRQERDVQTTQNALAVEHRRQQAAAATPAAPPPPAPAAPDPAADAQLAALRRTKAALQAKVTRLENRLGGAEEAATTDAAARAKGTTAPRPPKPRKKPRRRH